MLAAEADSPAQLDLPERWSVPAFAGGAPVQRTSDWHARLSALAAQRAPAACSPPLDLTQRWSEPALEADPPAPPGPPQRWSESASNAGAPVHNAACKVGCAGQAFARRGLRRGRRPSLRMWVQVVPQPVWSAFEMVAWAAASERARGHKWKIATSSHGRRSLPQ